MSAVAQPLAVPSIKAPHSFFIGGQWQKPAGSPFSRATEMALAATAEAMSDAGGAPRTSVRVGVILASNQGGMAASVPRYRELNFPYRRGPAPAGRLSRFLDCAPTTTLDLLMLAVGGAGPALTVSTACSAGLHALGMGFEMLRQGDVDVVVVSAVEVLTEAALAGFSVLRALTGGAAPRPFDQRRDGTLLGEGDRHAKMMDRLQMIVNNALSRRDFDEYTFVMVIDALGAVHRELPRAAGTQVEGLDRVRKALRPPPTGENGRIAERAIQNLAWRVEHAHADDFGRRADCRVGRLGDAAVVHQEVRRRNPKP